MSIWFSTRFWQRGSILGSEPVIMDNNVLACIDCFLECSQLMIVINPLVNWVLSFLFWSLFLICLLEWIFNVITARLFLIASCHGWLKCSVSSITSCLLITANITVSSFPPPLLHQLCGLGDRRVWFFSYRVCFKFYAFHVHVSAIKSWDCDVAFLAVLKILKLYFLLIFITCPLPCSKRGRHWWCWNYTLVHKNLQQ